MTERVVTEESRAIVRADENAVAFEWTSPGGRRRAYVAAVANDGSVRIHAVGEPLQAWGRWDAVAACLTLDRLQWKPSPDHPAGFDVAGLARAAANAIERGHK